MNRKRVFAAAAALLALTAAAGLWARLNPRETSGAVSASDGSMPDLVLIDISDQEAAASYHVETLGVYVLAVDQTSQAYAAGVRSGDRIVSANGVPVSTSNEFGTLRAQLEPSGELEMVLERGHGAESLTVTLVEDAP